MDRKPRGKPQKAELKIDGRYEPLPWDGVIAQLNQKQKDAILTRIQTKPVR